MKKLVKETLLDPATSSRPALQAWVKQSERTATELQASEGRFKEVDRALARHPNATSALLSTLSHSSDKATRKAVISHLAVLPEDFLRLGPQFPKEFLGNAALDLMLLEDVGRFLEFEGKLLVQIVKRENCPEAFIQWALSQGDEKLSLAVAMNPNISESVIALLQESQFKTVRESVAQHFSVAGPADVASIELDYITSINDRLANLTASEAHNSWKEKELTLVQFSCLAPKVRLVLAVYYKADPDDFSDNLGFVAGHPDSPIDLLKLLAKDKDERVRYRVAENPKCPISLLKALAKDEFRIRSSVARNPNCPVDLWELLANDSDERVRSSFASKPDCPMSMLEELATDGEWQPRSSVAKNPNCPVSLLKELTKDDEWQGRYGVAENPKCPVDLLALLAKDKENYVRQSVAANPNCPVDLLKLLAKDKDHSVRKNVADNQNCPASLLEVLAKDNEDWVRCNVAVNPNCPASLLKELVKDKDYVVRRNVAVNPNCPVSLLLEVLANDKDDRLHSSVARNSNSPVVLAALSSFKWEVRDTVASNPNCPVDLLILLAEDNIKDVRSSVASHPNCPVELLVELATDTAKEVRSEVASHPYCPESLMLEIFSEPVMSKILAKTESLHPDILEQLGQHDSEQVRTAALSNINHPEWRRTLETDLPANAWFQAQLKKAPPGVLNALAAGNILHFGGKDANKTVLSKRPIGRLLALSDGVQVLPERIARVSKNEDWLQRMAVARNLGTPPNILARLIKDPHSLVAAQALETQRRLSDVLVSPSTA